MAFYELIFIIRQDASFSEVDKITNQLIELISGKEFEGEVIKKEYWDLRTLAYKIKNNKKGHYVFLGISINKDGLKEVERKIKYTEEIIRVNVLKVKAISPEASPILKIPTSPTETVNLSR